MLRVFAIDGAAVDLSTLVRLEPLVLGTRAAAVHERGRRDEGDMTSP